MEMLLFIIGLSVNCFLVWILIRSRVEIINRESKIKTAENTITELRAQIQQKGVELNNLRAALNTGQEARVVAETRLEENEKNFEEQKRLLTEAERRLTITFERIINPLNDSLDRQETRIGDLERFLSGCAISEYKFGKLTILADRHGTDKGSNSHLYTEVYEYFFYPIQNEARKICEIGIWEGGSLRMLKDYFPNAVIYGIDINDASGLNSDRLKTFVADQADRAQLKSFIDTYGGDFDIIIDDAGHTMEQQQVSFGHLFQYVKPGGYYIIEEVHTSFYSHLGARYGAEENEKNTTLVMINNFIETGRIKSKYMTAEEENYLTADIMYCNLLGKDTGNSITCILKKK